MDHKPEAVRVKMLGGFSVSVGSRVLEENAWRLKIAAALVKMLALAPGHRLHREQVMDLLWPDSGRNAASNSLRRVLHSARDARSARRLALPGFQGRLARPVS
jgi:DNA-binding SARP family transcriptional activator